MKLFGLLNLNKPAGITSRDAVNRVQRLVKPAKVGHAGTLDPLASGVLIVGIGQATRLVEYVQRMPKQYRATFLLGRSSTTEDIEGEITLESSARQPSPQQLAAAAAELTGEIDQRPPVYSALKVAGRRAYALARGGQSVVLAPRKVQIHRLEITRYEYPELCLEVECGSGTYIRSLGRDLAERAGTAAVMSALVRTRIGHFTLDQAVDPSMLNEQDLLEHLLPPRSALQGIVSELVVSASDCLRLANGVSISAPSCQHAECAAVDVEGQLVAIVTRRSDGTFAAAKFFPTE